MPMRSPHSELLLDCYVRESHPVLGAGVLDRRCVHGAYPF